jgi:hypothetical protein
MIMFHRWPWIIPAFRGRWERVVGGLLLAFGLFPIANSPAQDHPLAVENPELDTFSSLPEPPPAPLQYSPNLFFPASVQDEQEQERELEAVPIQVDDVFSADVAGSAMEMQRIGFTEPANETEIRLYNVQYPLEDTIGESQPERAEAAVTPPLDRAWSPVFLGDETFLGRAFQKTGMQFSDRQLSFAVVPQSDGDFGLSTYSMKVTAAPRNAPFIRLTPRFAWHSLNGPSVPDVVSNLYEVDLTTTVFLPAGDRWSFMVAAAPGVYSDFDNMSSSAIRIVGRGLGFYQWSPDLKLMVGVTYLDRQDIKVLPAIGLVYTPDPDHKYDLSFPRPRVSVRYMNDGVRERWWYIGADLGGGSWAVRRENGDDDTLTYRDYRLLLGWEQREAQAFKFRMEAGYAFNRSIEYESSGLEFEQPASGVVQLGFDF